MEGYTSTTKAMKRKISQEQSDEKSSSSEKKRKKKDGSLSGVRPKNCPLSERQQLALLMQMTAEENNDRATSPTPQIRKTPGGSGRKDKVNKRNERGETPLHLATIRGDLDTIMDLIKQGADINVQDYAGWTPLHEACNHGYHHIAKFLLESGANVNSKGFENDYPLHDAVSNNHQDLVELLLKHGANPLLPNKHGERPMDLSESEAITKMMQQEVISSDESDSSQKFEQRKDMSKWRARSESESDHSTKSLKQTGTNPTSRQLFKSEKQLQKHAVVSSSFESDDSDDTPLIQRKYFSSSSSSNVHDVTNRRVARANSKTRKKAKKKNSLFSTSDGSSSDSEKPNKRSIIGHLQTSHRESSEEEEELPLSRVATKTHVITPHSSASSNEQHTVKITKPSTTDVYDLTDDFSNENDAISLKPESGRIYQDWENATKPTTIKSPSYFSRKTAAANVAGTKTLEKKVGKISKDVDAKQVEKVFVGKPSLARTPSPPAAKYQTSEMLFDQLFKTSPEPKSLESKFPTFSTSVTTGTNTFFSSTARILSSPGGISTAATTTTTTTTKVFSTTPLFSDNASNASSTITHDMTLTKSTPDWMDSPKNITKTNMKVDEMKRKRKSIDAESEEKVKKPEPSVTIRSISLDTVSTIAKEVDKQKSSEKTAEVKSVKKLLSDNKEKVAKTLSEPPKSTLKLKTGEPGKKQSSKIAGKKEVKPELKKVSLLSDSAFIGDIDTAARKRMQEKQLQRKKQQQKRRESFPNVKAEEKKTAKRSEVFLLDSGWLGTPDKQKPKKSQKSIKKEPAESTPATPVTVETMSQSVVTMKELPASVETEPTVVTTYSQSAEASSSLQKTTTPAPSVSVSSTNVTISDDAMPTVSEAISFVPPLTTEESDPAVDPPLESKPKTVDICNKNEPPAAVETSNDAMVSEKRDENVCDDLVTKDVMDEPEKVEELSEGERLLQQYIEDRLSMATICIESSRPKRLPVYIPMSKLQKAAKSLSTDKLNSYEERVVIQKLALEKRKRFVNIIPQAPQCYWEYMTFTGGYLLNGRRESHLSVPVLAPPPHLTDAMVDLFNVHEEQRVRLRVQHAIEREKLIISCEQEIMREHCRAARTIQNQQLPYSVCSVLMDNEIYNLPRTSTTEAGKPSIRDRFNTRLFISWLQDVDVKYEKMKSALLTRQKHEGETLYAMQKTEWCLKLQDLNHTRKGMNCDDINDVYVPMVNIADDFDLLPA